MSSRTVELAPSRAVAAWWSGLGLTAVALAVWVVVDSAGRGLAWALLVATVVVTVPFLAQLVVPARFTWQLDDDGLVVRSPLRVLTVRWPQVHLARVVTQLGEPTLELRLVDGEGQRTHLALLPVGTDLAVLHRALREHLAGESSHDVPGDRTPAGLPPPADAVGDEPQ
jgi:hypothetical protein